MDKPGVKTSEFWLALFVTVVAAAGAVYSESPIAQVGSIVAAALATAGYGFARAQTKSL